MSVFNNENNINKKNNHKNSKYYFQRLKKKKRAINNPFSDYFVTNNDLIKTNHGNNYYERNGYIEYDNTPQFWDNYLKNYYGSHYNNNTYHNNYYEYFDNYNCIDNYYATSIPPLLEKKENVEKQKPKTKVIINTPNSLKDLLKIIQEYKVSEDVEYNIDVESLKNITFELQELDEMIGADKIKQSVFEQLIYFIQNLHVEDSLLFKNSGDYKHTVIIGPPGSGKTKIAKIIGNMYSKIGVLKKNIFKKVTRNDLIAGYLGQTAIKTKKLIEDNLGGVLFIDEAYSLSHENQDDMFSKECVDTLCEALSDYKDDLMVIIAGYEGELENRFFKLNTGLESRFIWKFKMDAYNAAELMKIFVNIVEHNGWNFDNKETIKERWFKDKKDNFIGLGRDMEALFTYTKISHGLRIYGKGPELRKKISLEDMDKGYATFLLNNNKKTEPSFMHSIYL